MLVLQLRDSFSKAVTKNLIILLLGLFINYVNRGLIHTFCKHQVLHPSLDLQTWKQRQTSSSSFPSSSLFRRSSTQILATSSSSTW